MSDPIRTKRRGEKEKENGRKWSGKKEERRKERGESPRRVKQETR